MPISKRLRYEILRRDNQTCRYCGATALDVKLTVDHVIPVALGGSDQPSNLATACAPCNSGKAASSPDAPLVANVAEHALIWAQAMAMAAEERRQDATERDRLETAFSTHWNTWTWGPKEDRRPIPRPASWAQSLHRFLEAGLDFAELVALVDVAMTSTANDTWRYFCGCCWRRVEDLQLRTAEMANFLKRQERTNGA